MKAKLVLEYEIGDFPDNTIFEKEWLEEYFFQSDALIHDMEIVGVKYKRKNEWCDALKIL